MPPTNLTPLSGRYLSFAEREEIALLRARKYGVCEVARRVERSSSTISRELRRNAATRSGGFEYRASTAQWHADRKSTGPKVANHAWPTLDSPASRMVRLSRATAPKRCETPLPPRSSRSLSNDADCLPGTKALRWLNTTSCASRQDCRSTSATHTVHGSGVPTRTPMVSCASAFPRAPIYPDTLVTSSRRSLRHSTVGREKHAAGKPLQRYFAII